MSYLFIYLFNTAPTADSVVTAAAAATAARDNTTQMNTTLQQNNEAMNIISNSLEDTTSNISNSVTSNKTNTETFSQSSSQLVPPFLYLHCQVQDDNNNTTTTIVPTTVLTSASYYCIPINAPRNFLGTLVLGLNNHHVISYYWARSSGYGSSMIAPGVLYSNGYLYPNPNSTSTNDGKRSEWVQFLKPTDQIQLIPTTTTTSTTVKNIDNYTNHENNTYNSGLLSLLLTFHYIPIFAISRKDRPLGSEPIVIGEWILRQNKHVYN